MTTDSDRPSKRPSKKPVKRRDDEYEDYEDYESLEEKPSKPQRRTGNSKERFAPISKARAISTLDDLFHSDRSIWFKMLAGAIAAPIILVVLVLKGSRRARGDVNIDFSSPLVPLILIASAIAGAVLGALLTAKDVVHRRLDDGQPVAFPWRLLFGMRFVSIGCVWVPLLILAIMIGTILSI